MLAVIELRNFNPKKSKSHFFFQLITPPTSAIKVCFHILVYFIGWYFRSFCNPKGILGLGCIFKKNRKILSWSCKNKKGETWFLCQRWEVAHSYYSWLQSDHGPGYLTKLNNICWQVKIIDKIEQCFGVIVTPFSSSLWPIRLSSSQTICVTVQTIIVYYVN